MAEMTNTIRNLIEFRDGDTLRISEFAKLPRYFAVTGYMGRAFELEEITRERYEQNRAKFVLLERQVESK